MSERTIITGRKLKIWRISVYECEVTPSGVLYKLGKTHKPKRVGAGWYGLFDEHKLRNEIIKKLAEYVENRESTYPFLITQHRLKDKTRVHITPPKDIHFDPRKPATGHIWCAVVLSNSEYKLLSSETT